MLKSQLPLLLSLIYCSHEDESSDTAAPQGGHLGMPPLTLLTLPRVVGVYTYALSQRPNPPSILNFCPMREYPDTALELLGEARRKEVAS
jgi:hypothetical protein